MQQAIMPILIALILAAVGYLLLRGGDAVANWAYSPRRGRGAPPTCPNTAAKPVAAKRAPAKTTSSDS